MFSYAAVPYGLFFELHILSLLFFLLITGDRSGSDVYYSLKLGERLERPIHCPLYIYQIMIECWEWDEKKRPTFYQLVQLLKNHSVRKSLIIDQQNGNPSECQTIVQF